MLISIISSEKLFFNVNMVFSQTKDYTMTYSETEYVTACKYY